MDSAERPLDLLVIAAHPDDAELAVGGTILATIAGGNRVGIVDLTRGELSTRGNPEQRARETEAATALMGVHYRRCLDLPDGQVADGHEARLALVDVIRESKPRVLLAPWRDDLHPDHAGAGELAYRSLYLSGVGKFGEGRPPFRPATLGYYMCHTPFEPSVVVDVSRHWQGKMELMKAYSSQFHQEGVDGPQTKISRPDFADALEGRARDLGMRVGVSHGEAIRWQDPPAVADPVSLVVAGGLGLDGNDGGDR